MPSSLVPQPEDFAMDENAVASAERAAGEIFSGLVKNQPRAVMLWLASYFRQWDYAAKVYLSDAVSKE